MTELRTVYDLMAAAAVKLSGKPVLVRLQAPATKGVFGECHAGPDGRPIIDLYPGMAETMTLRVLLHEIAHAKLHTFKPSMVYKAGPGTLAANRKTPAHQTREDQAEALSKRWLDYGYRKADPGLGDLEGPLWALLDYKE